MNNLTVYRRYSTFGTNIEFNNDALGTRIANIAFNAQKNSVVFNPVYGNVYFKNLSSIYCEDTLYFPSIPKLTIDNLPCSGISIGTILLYPSSTPPPGWLICNGQSVSKSVYALLYSYLGDTYGTTATTFNLPNFTDRTPVHYTSTIPDYNAIGKTGGLNETTLNANQIPNHSHTGNTGGHSYNHNHNYQRTVRYQTQINRSGYETYRYGAGVTDTTTDYRDFISNHTHSLSTTSTIYSSPGVNVSQTFINTVHPSQTLFYIIKF